MQDLVFDLLVGRPIGRVAAGGLKLAPVSAGGTRDAIRPHPAAHIRPDTDFNDRHDRNHRDRDRYHRNGRHDRQDDHTRSRETQRARGDVERLGGDGNNGDDCDLHRAAADAGARSGRHRRDHDVHADTAATATTATVTEPATTTDQTTTEQHGFNWGLLGLLGLLGLFGLGGRGRTDVVRTSSTTVRTDTTRP